MDDLWGKRESLEPDQQDALNAYRQYLTQTYTIPEQSDASKTFGPMWQKAGQVAQAVGKGIDDIGGPFRTAVAMHPAVQAAQKLLAPKAQGVDYRDMLSALQGNPLSGNQILAREGVPQGTRPSEGLLKGHYNPIGSDKFPEEHGFFDPSPREAAGAGLDMATNPVNSEEILAGTGRGLLGLTKPTISSAANGVRDLGLSMAGGVPTTDAILRQATGTQTLRERAGQAAQTLASKMASFASPDAGSGAGALARPLGDAVQGAGRNRYNSAFTDVVRSASEDEGKDPQTLLDYLWNKGIAGRQSTLPGQLTSSIADDAAKQEELYSLASHAGAAPQFRPWQSVAPAENFIDKMKATEVAQPGVISRAEKTVQRFRNKPMEPFDTLLDTDRALQDKLRGKYGDAQQPSEMVGVQKKILAGRRQEFENAANTVAPGLGDPIHQVNQSLSNGYALEDPLEDFGRQGGSPITRADVGLMAGVGGLGAIAHGALGAMGLNPATAAALAITGKKLLHDLPSSTWGLTRGGQAIDAFGGMPLDAMLREYTARQARANSPWQILSPEEQQKLLK